jgi:hypothetical protein
MYRENLLAIANQIATEIRFPKFTSLIGNSEKNAIAILDAIKKAAYRDVYRAHHWSDLVEDFRLSSRVPQYNSSGGYYVALIGLDSIHDVILNDTMWDLSSERPIIGGLTDYEWKQVVLGGQAGTGNGSSLFYKVRTVYDITDPEVNMDDPEGNPPAVKYRRVIFIAPATQGTPITISCSMKRRAYVMPEDLSELKYEPTSDSDVFMLSSDLISLAATVRMLRSLGRSYGDQQAEFTALMKEMRQKDGGAPRLKTGGVSIGDELNIPGYVRSFTSFNF